MLVYFLQRLFKLIISLFYTPKFKNDDKKYSAIIVGAGFSGLGAAIQFKKRGFENFMILEKYWVVFLDRMTFLVKKSIFDPKFVENIDFAVRKRYQLDF